MFLFNRNLIYLALAATLSGCVATAQGMTEGTPASDDYISLYCKKDSKKEQLELTDSLNINLHIDGSGSMLGYINQDNSSYIQALKLLDTTLSLGSKRSNTIIEYHRSGDYKNKSKELTRSQFRKASKAEFYNGVNSIFPAVSSDLASIVNKPKNNNSLTVIVTDLDQNDGDVNLIANKIKASYFNQKDENYAIGVWGVKSEFDGTVYSASDANKKFQYSTSGKSNSQYRPFYVLFLGHHQDITDYFKKLQKEQSFGDRSKFTIFSPKHLLTDVSYLSSPTNLPSGLATPSTLHNGDVAVEKNNQPIELLEIKDKNADSLEAEYQVALKQASHTLSVDPDDLQTEINVTAFDKFSKKEFKPVPSAKKAMDIDDWNLNDNKLKFTTSINPGNFDESNIYYFKVDVLAKDLQKPDWWKEWNLNSGNDGSKTSNLYGFMNSLKNITLNSMDESALTVGRFCYAVQTD